MKTLSLIALAAIGFASASSASPEPHRYDVQVRLLEGGRLLATPRLITNAGQLATITVDDGKKGWSLKITATPDGAGNMITLATDVEFWEVWPDLTNRRRASTTMLVKEDDPVAFELAPQQSMPAMRVEISLHSV